MDNTAAYIKSTDMIYIAGGCNSPKGNTTYADIDGLELDFVLTMADMLQPWYIHTAVVAQNKLWLIGGQTIPENSIIAKVDVCYLSLNESNINLT